MVRVRVFINLTNINVITNLQGNLANANPEGDVIIEMKSVPINFPSLIYPAFLLKAGFFIASYTDFPKN